MTSEGHGAIESEMLFRSSIVELAVLGALILIFVVSIYMLRRGPRPDGSERASS
jgi:hypothetical protein